VKLIIFLSIKDIIDKLKVICLFFFLIEAAYASEPISVVTHSNKSCYAAAISDDARFSLIANDDGAFLWDLNNHVNLYKWNLENKDILIQHVALSQDGNIAVTAAANEIAVWDTNSGESKGYWLTNEKIRKLEVNHDGSWGLIAEANGVVGLLELSTGRYIWQIQLFSAVKSIALSKDDKYAVMATSDKSIFFWEIETSTKIHYFEFPEILGMLALDNSTSNLAISCAYKPVKIWHRASEQFTHKLSTNTGPLAKFSRELLNPTAIKFSKSGNLLVVASPPGKIFLWDINTGTLVNTYTIKKPNTFKPKSVIIHAINYDLNESEILAEASNGKSYRFKI